MRSALWFALACAGGLLVVACASTDDLERRRASAPYPTASTRETAIAPETSRVVPVTPKRERSTTQAFEMRSHPQPSTPPPVDRQPRPGPTGPRPK